MKIKRLALAAMITALLAGGVRAKESEPADKRAKPRVEVVFVLDTTGSMSGLIEGAKVKIWKIVNQIVSGDPVPDVRVGLVAYRDKSDAYVTRFTPLSDDLDQIYGVLRGFKADGGGDKRESVNQALHEGFTKPRWSTDDRTLRLIFLVGDAPPHMDYEQDVKYPVTCEAAARAGIIINTVQCGADSDTRKVWEEIARKAEGRYAQIDQSGGMVAVNTPFDKRLAELSTKLSGTTVFYGSSVLREQSRKLLEDAEDGAAAAPDEAKAERAGYRAKSGRVARGDLIGLLERDELDPKDVDAEKLPESLKKMSAEKRTEHLTKLLAERKAIRKELLDLDAKRAEYVKDELAKRGAKGDAFDEQVLETLREQAKRIGVKYE